MGKSLFPSTSFGHILDAPSTSATLPNIIDLIRADLRPNGVPLIITTEPSAYVYDPSRSEWTCICSTWYLEGNDTRRGRSEPAGPLAEIEAEILDVLAGRSVTEAEKPEWWSEAMELGHLEGRMRAAELLDSKDEYKHWLVRYASLLGKEGFRGRAEELVRELMGPVFE